MFVPGYLQTSMMCELGELDFRKPALATECVVLELTDTGLVAMQPSPAD